MKNKTIKKLVLIPLLLVLLNSCSPMGKLYTTIYAPPIVKLPEHIKKIGIVNRSLPVENKGNKALTNLEALLSGEGILEDRNGSFSAMSGAELQINSDTLLRATQLKEMLLP
jgi:hypothetical protein